MVSSALHSLEEEDRYVLESVVVIDETVMREEKEHRGEADSFPSFIRDGSLVVDSVPKMSSPSDLGDVDEIQRLGELSKIDRVGGTVDDGGRYVTSVGFSEFEEVGERDFSRIWSNFEDSGQFLQESKTKVSEVRE